MTSIFSLLSQSKKEIALCGLCSLGSGASSGLLLIIISEVIAGKNPAGPAMILSFAAMVVISQWLRYLANITITKLVETATVKTRLTILDALRQSRLETFETLGHANIHTVLTDDCAAIRQFIPDIIETITGLITVTICMGYLFWIAWPIFFLTAGTGLLSVVIYLFRQKSARHNLEASRLQLEGTYSLVIDFLSGFKELKISLKKSQDLFTRHIQKGFDRTRDLLIQAAKTVQMNYSLGLGLFFALIGMVMFVLPRFFAEGNALTAKTTVVILYMVAPGGHILYTALQMPKLKIALNNLNNLRQAALSGAADPPPNPLDRPLTFSQTLCLNEVRFTYPDTREQTPFRIGPVNLTLRQGSLIFLTGGNGNGKTTLLKILTGLYSPDQGQILVDGQEIGTGNLSRYRDLFAVVFSDFHLFDRLYGIDAPDPDFAAQWTAAFHLSHKLSFDGNRFSTRVLSSGQKRRLALLVALMEQKPILVCDEFAADQEPAFREYFYTTFIQTMKAQGKTVIIVTHDDRYFHLADQLITMEYGTIREKKT